MRILQFLETWQPRGRGIVIFSCEPANIWEVVPLEMYVPSFVDIDTTTNTGVLLRLLSEHPRVAVVVIQRDAARIYLSRLTAVICIQGHENLFARNQFFRSRHRVLEH